MALDPVLNFAKCTVSTGYDGIATSIVLSAGEGAELPAPATDGAFNLTWYNDTDYKDPSDDPNKEIVRCTARSTDTLTVTRGQEGVAATVKNLSGKTYKMVLGMTKKMLNDIETAIGRFEIPSGNVNGVNVTFTVVNTPKFIVVDGMVRRVDHGYTYSTGTITVSSLNPPADDIFSFY